MRILENKIDQLNVEAAKEDIYRFIRDPREIEIWSKDFFKNLSTRITFAH
jgi:hypothetical protein